MRTLLVSSQKGGVGKTTTAANLAALAAADGLRVLLLDADPLGSVSASFQLVRDDAEPGFLTADACRWSEVAPNLDAACPYPADGTPEASLEAFLAALPTADGYDVVVIDAPPMLGPRPKALLRAVDEVVIVLRAEPMSFRTLPAYLGLVREVKADGAACRIRGILLTLPEGVSPGSKSEAKLREKFPGLLPQTVPFDPEVGRALIVGRPLVATSPRSPAARQYRSLALALGLTSTEKPAPEPELVAAAAGIASRIARPAAATPGGRIGRPTPVVDLTPADTVAVEARPESSGWFWLTLVVVAVLSIAGGVAVALLWG